MFYNGNPKLRAANVVLEYTQEQMDEIVKCIADPIYFIKNYVKIVSLDEGLINFKLYPYQENMIRLMQDNNRVIILSPRQSGKSQTVAAFLLHYTLFQENKKSAILANKERTAREILGRMKNMYENLPIWMQQGVNVWNKGSIELEGGSKVISSSTSSSAIRGESVNLLALDETAFVPENVWDEFFSSVYPTVAASHSSKIIMTSTPQSLNHFYKLWMDSKNGKNGFVPLAVNWDDIPGRDEDWRYKTIAEIGERKFRQEFECKFEGSSNTLLDGKTLERLVFQDPVETQDDGRFRIYEHPTPGRVYVAFFDVAEGLEQDSSTIQIIDVTQVPYKQVAVYENNTVKTNQFHLIVNRICSYYSATTVGENNSIGMEVLNNLNYDTEYGKIFYDSGRFGLRMTQKTKRSGNAKLKEMIDTNKLILSDFKTIFQFSTYIEKGSTFKADDNKHDDLVTPFVLFAYFMNNSEWTSDWLDQYDVYTKLNLEFIKRIEDNILPFYYNNGHEEFELK